MGGGPMNEDMEPIIESRNMVLDGHTGNGENTTGNSILESDTFQSSVVGLLDADIEQKSIAKETVGCINSGEDADMIDIMGASSSGDCEDTISNGHRTIVLFGCTGNGKSSTGNSILGRKAFKSKAMPDCVTGTSVLEKDMRNGLLVNVIDTPGLFDVEAEDEFISKEIINCIDLAKDGIHAVLMVFSVNRRFSKEDERALHILQVALGGRILDYVVVVFTGVDMLEDDGETVEDFLARGFPEPLQNLLDACKDRKVFIDNKTTDEDKKGKQLQNIFNLINVVIEQNEGRAFTNELFQELKEHNSRQEHGIYRTPSLAPHYLLNRMAEMVALKLAKEKPARSEVNATPPESNDMLIDNYGGSSSGNHMDSTLNGPRTIVLFGRTGNGKSSTGNSILGRKAFKPKALPGGEKGTTVCESHIMKNGQVINVIDTPGLFDAGVEDSSIYEDIVMKCKYLAKDGIHALLMVLSMNARFSTEEATTLELLQNVFGPKILDYVIIVFTGLDVLDDDGDTIQDFLSRGLPEPLQKIIVTCKDRRVFFDNKTKDGVKKEKQLRELFVLVDRVIKQNGGEPFSTEILHEFEHGAMLPRQHDSTKYIEQNHAASRVSKQQNKNSHGAMLPRQHDSTKYIEQNHAASRVSKQQNKNSVEDTSLYGFTSLVPHKHAVSRVPKRQTNNKGKNTQTASMYVPGQMTQDKEKPNREATEAKQRNQSNCFIL